MLMSPEQARQLMTLFQHVRRYPGMYFPLDRSGIIGFLSGVYACGLTFLAAERDPEQKATVLQERGWDSNNALAPWPDMEERGFTLEEMIEEVLTIEIEVLHRIYNVE
jgi:hypothetical protein